MRAAIADRSRLPDYLMAAALVAALPFLLYMQRSTGPFQDEWLFLTRPDTSLSDLFSQFNGHLMVFTKLAVEFNDAQAASLGRAPIRLLSVGSHLLLVAVTYLYMRTRIERWFALALAVLMLGLGAGWEVIGGSYSFGWMLAMALGTAALLVFESGDSLRTRAGTAGLLILGLLASGVIYAYIAAIAVQVVFKQSRRKAMMATALPLVLAAAYYLIEGRHGAAGGVQPSGAPSYSIEMLLAAAGQLFGSGAELGAALTVLAVVGLLLAFSRTERLQPAQLSVVALPLFFVLMVGASRAGTSFPSGSSRYVFTLLAMYPLVASEYLRGWRPNRNVAAALAVIFLFALSINLKIYADQMHKFRSAWPNEKAYLLALEEVGPEVAMRSGVKPPFLYVDFSGLEPELYRWMTERSPNPAVNPNDELMQDPAAAAQIDRLVEQMREGAGRAGV